MAFYKKRVVRHDTPADIQWRFDYRKAAEMALRDTQARYPLLTVENFAEANDYREHRTQELLKAINGERVS